MGFIAQDMQEVFPDLVSEKVPMMDSEDEKLLKEEYDSDTSLTTKMTGRNWAIIVSAVK